MTGIAFDTLEYSNTLQDAGVPQGQAEAIARAQSKALREVINAQQFATKSDIYEVKAEIQTVRTELKEEVHEARTELAATKHELIKWLVGALLAQTALLVAIISFVR